MYIYLAHTAFSVSTSIQYDTEAGWAAYAYRTNLWMPATISWWLFANFHTQKHAASVGLRHACMNVSAGLSEAYATPSLLLWRACIPVVKAGWMFILDPATEHCGQRCDRNRMHAFLFREACMLIMIRKHHTRAYLTRWWNLFYFDGPHL